MGRTSWTLCDTKRNAGTIASIATQIGTGAQTDAGITRADNYRFMYRQFQTHRFVD